MVMMMMVMAFDALSAATNWSPSSGALIVGSINVILQLPPSWFLGTVCSMVFVLAQAPRTCLPTGCNRVGGSHVAHSTTDASKHASKFALDAWLTSGSWLLGLGALHSLREG